MNRRAIPHAGSRDQWPNFQLNASRKPRLVVLRVLALYTAFIGIVIDESSIANACSRLGHAQTTEGSDAESSRAQEPDPSSDPASASSILLARHLVTLGGTAGFERALDLELTGTFDDGTARSSWHLLVRRSPFAMREEIGTPGANASPFVAITDGDQAWRLRPDGKSEPLPAAAAISVLESAFVQSSRFLTLGRFEGVSEDVRPLEDWASNLPPEIERGPRVRALSLRDPLGVLWLAFFSDDGRLHGMCQRDLSAPRWLRFGAWKEIEGVSLPMMIVEGQSGVVGVRAMRIDRARIGVQHDQALFVGDPQPPIEGVVRLGALQRVPASVPGSGYLAMPDVIVGAIKTWAYVDTGAGDVYCEPALARELKLPFLGREPGSGGVQKFVADVHWLDVLELPGRRLLQLPLRAVSVPGTLDLGPSMRPHVILGGRALFDGSPVFDLEGKALLLRGTPVSPLEKIAQARRATSDGTGSKAAAEETSRAEALHVPFSTPRPNGPFIAEISIGDSGLVPVLFDTGCPYVLRLSASGLRHAGLPTARKAWLERGARMSFKYAGAGGGEASTDLLVRLDEFALGSIRWRRPWVLLAGLGGAEEATELWYEGLLGAGAVFAFARFGLDFERNRIELEPGAQVERASDNSWIVPDQGQYLGLQFEAGQVHSDQVLGSPRVVAVAAESPAARAGVQIGDRLLAIGGSPCALQVPAQLNRELWVREGNSVTITISREGRGWPFEVVLP